METPIVCNVHSSQYLKHMVIVLRIELVLFLSLCVMNWFFNWGEFDGGTLKVGMLILIHFLIYLMFKNSKIKVVEEGLDLPYFQPLLPWSSLVSATRKSDTGIEIIFNQKRKVVLHFKESLVCDKASSILTEKIEKATALPNSTEYTSHSISS